MASITLDDVRIDSTAAIGARFIHRLSVLARAWRRGRTRRALGRLVQSEMRDPRWYADIGIDMETYGRRDWLAQMVQAMGGRP